jgi:hypothetical protein
VKRLRRSARVTGFCRAAHPIIYKSGLGYATPEARQMIRNGEGTTGHQKAAGGGACEFHRQRFPAGASPRKEAL